jgi:dissimilatory sulfite reductase (desulfoviridin) alpha/beta subunit
VEEEGEEFMAILEETVEVSMHMMNARTDVLAELAEKSGGEYYTWEVQGAEPV